MLYRESRIINKIDVLKLESKSLDLLCITTRPSSLIPLIGSNNVDAANGTLIIFQTNYILLRSSAARYACLPSFDAYHPFYSQLTILFIILVISTFVIFCNLHTTLHESKVIRVKNDSWFFCNYFYLSNHIFNWNININILTISITIKFSLNIKYVLIF